MPERCIPPILLGNLSFSGLWINGNGVQRFGSWQAVEVQDFHIGNTPYVQELFPTVQASPSDKKFWIQYE